VEVFSDLLTGFSVAFSGTNLLIALAGVVLGMIIGVLPGLGAANGVAILLPVTFTMAPSSAVIFLGAIYYAACFAGSITSILFNIPGEPWSVATTFDGHPLAKKGQAAQALIAAFTASLVGGMIAVVLLTLFAPPLAEFALRFGPPEYFAVMFLAFGTFTGLGGSSPAKTVVAILLGLTLSTVGLDIITGRPRLIFGGISGFYHGIEFIVAAIGLFGIGDILVSAEESLTYKAVQVRIPFHEMLAIFRELRYHLWIAIRSGLIGFFLGILPAAGATPASFINYALTKRFARNPQEFGEGAIAGVIAPEAANNGAATGAFLPMITLGIPGSPTTAVILGGLLIWGLQPGPLLFVEHKDFVWGLIASIYIGNILAVLLCLFASPLFAAIMRVPYAILTPLIVLFCTIGAYAVNSSLFDVWVMLVFGVIGYICKKLDYPLAPLVLALVLGDMTEKALRQSLIMSHGSFLIFFNRPIAGVCMGLALFLFLFPLLLKGFRAIFPSAASRQEMLSLE
jgi:putative tricarboxylic transport membrane protein